MCLAVPMRVSAVLEDQLAEVEIGGVSSRVSLALIEAVSVGDYVIVHAGFAIARLNVEQAEQSLTLFEEIAARLGDSPDALRPSLP